MNDEGLFFVSGSLGLFWGFKDLEAEDEEDEEDIDADQHGEPQQFGHHLLGSIFICTCVSADVSSAVQL